MRRVLLSSATQLWKHCDPRPIASIVVYHRSEGPVCNFQGDALGRVKIGLNTTPNQYAQQAYQFAHEFCHALAIHSRAGQKQDIKHCNQWLEECLCETASLFALRGMASDWKHDKDFAPWTTGAGAPYHPSLAEYAQNVIEKVGYKTEESFGTWFLQRHKLFRAHPIAFQTDQDIKTQLRADFGTIASRLLPLFEATPSGWEAVSFLNLTSSQSDKSFLQHLEDWRDACPNLLKSFVSEIQHAFPNTPGE